MTLVLSHVSKTFTPKQRAPLRAVDDVTFAFEAGRLCTILGPSGCGKTTLLRMIAGFEQPTSGDIIYNDRRMNDVPPYLRGFPMVFQSYALFPHLSVRDNVAYGLRVRKVPPAERAARALEMLELLGLASHEQHRPGQLSGGQQQRVALARALVLEPELILLDEPLSNLDAGLRVAMRSEIRALQQRLGITAIYVTHDQEEALAISDTILVMNGGRVEQAAAPREIHQRPASEFVARFMGCPNIVPIVRRNSAVELFGALTELPQCSDSATRLMIPTDAVTLSISDAGAHEASIVSAAFLGARVEYVILGPDDARMTVHAPASAQMFSAGDRVGFDVDYARIYCF